MRNLDDVYSALNLEQQDAVDHQGNVVVLAGPGSGKTETVVIKVARLLATEIQEPHAVACITFGNSAVDEFRARLERLGINAGRRLYLGTVHSFSLNCIVRPFGHLVDPSLENTRVAADRVARRLLAEIAERHDPDPKKKESVVTKIRRKLACGEDVSGFPNTDLAIAREYEGTLRSEHIVDFEGMILSALSLVEKHDWISRLVATRYPWLIIDEYQDLGGPLHNIVMRLVAAGSRLFAVGDPDQTVYDFLGADPKYLEQVCARDDFHTVRLRFNYRSGGDLIAASQAALSPVKPRGYEPHPESRDKGQVFLLKADDSLDAHGNRTIDAVQRLLAEGVTPHEVAVFYHASWQLYPELRASFETSNIAYNDERDQRFPRSPTIEWLQLAAAWATSNPEAREKSFATIATPYLALLRRGGAIEGGEDELLSQGRFYRFLRETTADTDLSEWLSRAERELDILSALRRARDEDDLETLEDIISRTRDSDPATATVQDFAAGGRREGRIVLTTFHSSKGRQFDAVILPGLVEGVMPWGWRWNGQRRIDDPPAEEVLAEARRLFYVGFTRARHKVILIWSSGYYQNTRKGPFLRSYGQGMSRFVIEINQRLSKGK